MPRCCREAIPPKIDEGRHVRVTGNATPQDPLVISATTDLSVQDNSIFNLILDGNGTLESPWRLQVAYAPTARLNHIPDVLVGTDTPNGHVLTYDKTNGVWTAAPPVTAAPGAVSRSNGLTGDGSAGAPLTAVGNAARYISVTASGIGLSDAGVNSLIRTFATPQLRTAMSPAPIVNTLSLVETNPDVIERWTGTGWEPVTGGRGLDIQAGELLALSGSYAGGSTTDYVSRFTTVTDSTGAFEVIAAEDLTGYSGVLDCQIQETGSTFYHAQVAAGVNNIIGYARRLDTGGAHPNASISGTVRALLY